jgi:hypothetical protein
MSKTRYYLSAKACSGILRRAQRRGKNAADTASASIGSGSQWAAGTSPNGDFLTTSVTSKWHKGSGGPSGSEHYNMVVEESSAYKFDALSSNSMKSSNPNSGCNEVDVASTLDTWRPDPSLNQGGIAIVEPSTVGALAARDYKGVGNQYVQENKCIVETSMLMFDTQFGSNANVFENQSPTLKASQASPSIAYSIQDGREIEKNQNGLGVADEGAPAYTIDQTGAQAIAYSIREDAKAGNFSVTELDHANSLSALQPSPQSHHAQMFIAEPTMVVRRLTPLECERLMGWPDDHTRYKADGIEQADTHRYKQCGNGVASPVAEWIGEQLRNL